MGSVGARWTTSSPALNTSRAAHRFDGESERVAFSDGMIGGLNPDPVTGPIPADSDIGCTVIGEPNCCIPLRSRTRSVNA